MEGLSELGTPAPLVRGTGGGGSVGFGRGARRRFRGGLH